MVVGLIGACLTLVTHGQEATFEVPAGRTLEIRLTKSLASFSSKKGNEVEGLIIAPVLTSGHIVIPMGAKITGFVQSARRVGLGLIHETARLSLDFNKITLPDGSQTAITTRVVEIDNSRESVDREGRVNGIRSTNTLGYRANNLLAGFAMFDPVAYVYVNVAAARMLRFSEPEIWFPAGTELSVKLVSPVKLEHCYEPPVPAIQDSTKNIEALRFLIRRLPYRTATENTNKPSDLTNLVFLGSPAALERAFRAAGWVQSDRLNTISGFLTLRSIAENQRYQSAPMSVLLLDEQRPRFTFSKTLDTFSKRHHARIWLRAETWQGMPVLTASSTQDIGIQLSRKNKTFIHTIDTNIDNERTKITNDLIFTGCVTAAELYPRPLIAPGVQNATGENLITDNRVAVLQLNECTHPRDPVDLQVPPGNGAVPNPVERGFRQGILITRNDIYRGNLIYQGYEGTRLGLRHLKHKEKAPQGTNNGSAESAEAIPSAPETADDPLELPREQQAESSAPPSISEAFPRATSEGPPLFELGVEGGSLAFGNALGITTIGLESKTAAIPSFNLFAQNRLHNGWGIGTSVTLNSWKYLSNEFSFDYQRGTYRLGLSFSGIPGQQPPIGYQEQTTGLLTNQFGYALVINLRPREKRLRPFIAAGLAFQLLHITDAPFKSSGGIFNVGLKNVGLILAAYNFANNPPLDGGGIFQFGFQYGGGVKYRFSRHWMAKIDYRETLSAQPNFVERSIKIDDPSDSDQYTVYHESNQPTGPLREQRLTGGISFIF
jgi:opacity protein-like surface antigen